MPWIKNSNILGNEYCTQFTNTVNDELNPQNAYQTTPFINDNTTSTQTITFSNFDSLVRTELVNTKSLTATSDSGLTVLLTSSNTNIATITGGNTLNAIASGTITITATQSGNVTYDPATPIICTFTITINQSYTGPNSYIEYPIVLILNTQKSNIKTITPIINDIRYTQYSGISYGYATGFHGSAMVGSINCIDINDNPITDFSGNALGVTLSMANANNSHVYKIYKRTGSTVIDPQPSGYPVTLTYQSGTNWTGSMVSLSDIVVLDESPPSGNAGGDPYIMSVKKVKTLLPNNWHIVNLLETESTKIIAYCDFIDSDIISNLHFINKNKQQCMEINPTIHKWVRDLTYIKHLYIVNKFNNRKLVLNTIDSTIESDDSNFLYETITDNKYGLYSMTHIGYYPQVAFKKYLIHFNEGRIAVSIDNYWDDINYIQLFLNNESDYDKYTGELIEHNQSNAIEIK